MSQYKLSEITNTFWASNEGFKGGRDPMGIQNSSIATYSRLLPGLTNLTGHIRYYSLYCWLLSEYDKLEEQETTIHQYNFIRRAELAMALIMKNEDVVAVVGALFVSQEKYHLINEGLYDLSTGGDYESKDKYWAFKSGAFGQYYLGSLIHYELVKIEEGRFYLRNKGKELAAAVRDTVSEDIRELFITCIERGQMKEDERKKLIPLALNELIEDTPEWKALNNLLVMKDKDESSLRRETVLLFLKDNDGKVSVDNFVKNRFLHVNDEKEYKASFGWYFYYLCEVFHFCIESIFCLILNEISDLHNPSMSILIDNLKGKLLFCFKDEKDFNTLYDWKEIIRGNIDEMYDELKECINTKDYLNAAARSITLLLRLQSEFEKNEREIRNFENENDLSQQRGILSNGLRTYVVHHAQLSIEKYIETIICQIMQEHTIVAIRKMGNTNADLRKFVFEDGRVVLVEIRYPTETNPRINSLYNFLQDLKYIDSDGALKDKARSYIQNYGKE